MLNVIYDKSIQKYGKHVSYGDKNTSGPFEFTKDYDSIKASMIADVVGGLMNPIRTLYHGQIEHISSIFVAQTKEKFGTIRVYVDLASNILVMQRWYNSYKMDTPSILDDKLYNTLIKDPIFENFARTCRYFDILKYRKAYLKAFALFPDYIDCMRNGADHPELLFLSKEEIKKGLPLFFDRQYKFMDTFPELYGEYYK